MNNIVFLARSPSPERAGVLAALLRAAFFFVGFRRVPFAH